MARRGEGCERLRDRVNNTIAKDTTMDTTHDDNATSWRALADQLTDRERAALEHLEQETQG
jgi:hypothetical protein